MLSKTLALRWEAAVRRAPRALGVLASLALGLSLAGPRSAAAADLDLQPGDDLPTLLLGLGPGDTATFASGVYTIETQINLDAIEGTEQLPVVLRAASGAVPIIESAGGNNVIRIADSSWISVSGLTLRGNETWQAEERGFSGVRVASSSNITLDRLDISDVGGSAIYAPNDVSQLTVTSSHLHNIPAGTGIYAGCGNGSCWSTDGFFANNWIHDLADGAGIVMALAGQGNVISDNVIYGLSSAGISVSSTELGEANQVEGNVVWNVRDHGIWVGGSAVVRNNIVFDVEGRGIEATPANGDAFDGVVLSFNTVSGATDWAVEINGWAEHTGMVLANNAINNATGLALKADLEDYDEFAYVSSNVVTGYVTGFEELQGHFRAGHGLADFSDAPNWNFYPTLQSSLLDSADPAGESYVPDFDFNGLPREGNTPDVGAYERSLDENPGWLIREGFKLPPEVQFEDVEIGGCDCAAGDGAAGEAAAALLPLALLGLGLRRRRDGLEA